MGLFIVFLSKKHPVFSPFLGHPPIQGTQDFDKKGRFLAVFHEKWGVTGRNTIKKGVKIGSQNLDFALFAPARSFLAGLRHFYTVAKTDQAVLS